LRSRVLGMPRAAWTVLAASLLVLAAVAALLPPRGTPGVEVADLGEALALLLHLVGYAALALSATVAQQRPRLVTTAVGLAAYATGLEVLQGLLGERSFQVQDVVANVAGVIGGVLLGAFLAARVTARR
jgi:VanZ family protein